MKALFLFVIVFASCSQCPKETTKILEPGHVVVQKQIVPAWLKQNVDTAACFLLPCEGMRFIKIGNKYTATYTLSIYKNNAWVLVKAEKSKTGLDFNYRGMPYMYDDSCSLKESLRDFIRLKMVQNMPVQQ